MLRANQGGQQENNGTVVTPEYHQVAKSSVDPVSVPASDQLRLNQSNVDTGRKIVAADQSDRPDQSDLKEPHVQKAIRKAVQKAQIPKRA